MAGASVELDRNQPTTIGSGADCALRLAEPGIAAQHAVVKALRDEGFGIKALAPGLRVNGSEVEAAPLKEGDTIELGASRVVYSQEELVIAKGPSVRGFQILRELGRGGMGKVYLAEQTSLKRQVALKVLDKKRTSDPAFVAKFVAEARAAAKLSHPNVVHVFDVDQDGGTYSYAMELMHHGSLEAWLKKNGKMPIERALQVVADAAAGLAYAESLRIVHRDIKPDNLMLDQHGTVKIADLGLAFTDESGEEQAAGTPHFMAPEQVLRKQLDHRTDLYALGCTFYRLVTGKTPFKGQTVKDILRAQVKDEAEPAHKADSAVTPEVSAIIQKLMQKEPGDRYQSANELLEAVHALLQPPAKKGLWIGLAVAGAVLASGAIWWAVNKPKDVIEKTEYIDNPEAARLAGVNKELEAKNRELEGTVALLRARLDGGSGETLAKALDEIAAAHSGSKAAAQATELAMSVRADADAKRKKQEASVQTAQTALAALRAEATTAQASADMPRAFSLLLAAKAPEGADAEAFDNGVRELRAQVVAAAAAHLLDMKARIESAQKQGDATAVRQAARALGAIVGDQGWPSELVADKPTLLAASTAALALADTMESSATEARWKAYANALHQQGGVADALARVDFAAAKKAMESHAQEAKGLPMGDRAEQLAQSLDRTAKFYEVIQQTIPTGQAHLQLPGADTPLTWTAWRMAEGQLVFADPTKKPVKETVIAAQDVTIEQWETLLAQIPEATDLTGSRSCALAFLAVAIHQRATRSYLQGVKTADDASGTGATGYPLGVTAFDVLLQQLPVDAPWAQGIRAEVAASRMLAAGMRALSERRNLAAANHIDRLLLDHPHSICVTGMK